MTFANDTLLAILQQALPRGLLIGSLLALLFGLLLILSPAQADALSRRYNRWYSLRHLTRPLDIPRSVEHHFYRHHRAVGLFLILAASYILYRFAFDYSATATLAALRPDNVMAAAWLLDALQRLLIPFSLFVILLGAVMALKPSALKGPERQANSWITGRRATRHTDRPHDLIDRWTAAHPRLCGTLLCLAALYLLAQLWLLLPH